MKTALKLVALMFAVAVAFSIGFFALPIPSAFADGNVAPNGATPVTISSTQAATTCGESTVAAGSATALTITVPAGQYFYMTNLSSTINAIAAPVATLYPTTQTGLPGTFSIRQAAQATVFNINQQETFPGGLKSATAGTNVVFTGTALANVSASLRVCGFFAP